MTLLGLLTLLSLVSSSNGLLTGSWLSLLGKGFGWGMYLLPLGLVGVGIWLVLRHFDRLPQLVPERLVGLVLLFLNLLAWMHFFSFPADRSANFMLADQAGGGGYAGGAVLALLRPSLGWAGTAVVLVAWLLIALALSLDLSVPEMFTWVSPLLIKIAVTWESWISRWSNRRSVPSAHPGLPSAGFSSGPVRQAAASTSPARYPQPPAALGAPVETHAWVLPALDQILESGGKYPSTTRSTASGHLIRRPSAPSARRPG
jgi:S-DNA-T family DNA segregation ATPase FtsK/SpoIIIE